jgi:hypothetical protein
MTDAPNPEFSAQTPPYEDAGTAPFIYFDIAPSFGVFAGAIQIELASRILIPNQSGTVDVKLIATGRCDAAQRRRSIFAPPLKRALK